MQSLKLMEDIAMPEQSKRNEQKRDRWFYALDGIRRGPHKREELIEMLPEIEGPDTWVKGPGIMNWKRARDVKALGLENELEDDPPHPAFWLTYLFFMPNSFFRYFVLKHTPGLTVLCAWIYGIAGAIDRMDQKILLGKGFQFIDSWGSYWLFAITAGIFGGIFYFIIGGWWYIVRLGFSGAKGSDMHLARRVYLFASQVWAVPALLAATVETGRYNSPLEMATGSASYWDLIIIIFPFWSVWTSYVGVCSAFPVRRNKARLWFLILPCLVYLLAFLLSIGLFTGFADSVPADMKRLNTHESNTMYFSYPGNWVIDTNKEDYDPDHSVYVEPIMQDAIIKVMIYESYNKSEEELEATLNGFREGMEIGSLSSSFNTMGSYEGTGSEYKVLIEGNAYTLRQFASQVGDGVILEAFELYQSSAKSAVLPGFMLIKNSLRVKL